MNKTLKTILLWILAFYMMGSLPVMILLAKNEWFRWQTTQMLALYFGKIDRMTYVFVGDSITAGGRNIGWQMEADPFCSYNMGVSGHNLHQSLKTAQCAIAKQKPKWVCIMAGTNDTSFTEAVLNRNIEADFKETVVLAHQNDVRILVTITPLSTDSSLNPQLRAIGQKIRETAEKAGVDAIVDLNPHIAPEGVLLPEYTLDGVHFSPKCYELWFEKLKDAIKNTERRVTDVTRFFHSFVIYSTHAPTNQIIT